MPFGALLTLLLVLAPGVAPQTEYVIVKPGAKEYHRSGCDVIRDAKDVVAMTRAEAEARGLRPHAGCDPSKQRDDKTSAQIFVYVQPNGTYYHRAGCSRAGKSPRKITLDEAAGKYWPCPHCKPPIRKRKDS